VLVSEADPRLFSGVLRAGLDPRPDDGATVPRPDRLVAALHVAAAGDVLEALPEGLDTEVDEAGRGFSGGQRQRLALARVVLADPEVLVLVEPTSAVDAHTEVLVAERLRAHRHGEGRRTTVVTTASPLLLDRCDEVAFVRGGRVVTRGTHRDLLANDPDYRETVTRGEAE
jgi:ABC-type multidrug transport system fused ATPase/permease subunit